MNEQIEEIRVKEEANLEEAKRRRAAQKETIRRSREQQIERKVAKMERQHIEDAIMTQEWSRRAEAMNQLAEQEEVRTAEINIHHQNSLVDQMHTKRAHSRANKFRELEGARQHRNRQDEEDEVFEGYAEDQIRSFAAQGRTVVPMKLVLNKQEKRKTRLVVH